MDGVTRPRFPAVAVLLALVVLVSSACVKTKNPEGWASPTLTNSSLLYLQNSGRLAAVSLPDAGNAATQWTFPDSRSHPDQKDLKLKGVYSDPVVSGDLVIFASYDGDVYALAAADGIVRWHAKKDRFNGSVVSGPVLAGEVLVVATVEGDVYGLNKADGAAAAGWPTGGVHLGKGGVWAPPVALPGDRVAIATMGGDVLALNVKDGSEAWRSAFKASGAIADLAPLGDTYLFVPTLTGQVAVLNATDGSQVGAAFKASDWVWTTPAYVDGVAYFGDFGGDVYALDIATMQPRWTYATGDRVKATPAVVDGTVIVADRKPVIHFLNAQNGELLNKVPLLESGTVRAGLTGQAGKALIATTAGKLFAADPKQRAVSPIDVKAAAR